jgi:CRP-like cAMP-binding protein
MTESVLAKLKKLDEQREQLIADAKKEALDAAQRAIDELNALGFNYRIVEGGSSTRRATTGTRTRRSGRREAILNTLREAPDGLTRADILEKVGAKGDTKQEQSISNALTNMKKAGQIDQKDGKYVTTGG